MPFVSINPATEHVVHRFPSASTGDIDQSLKVAAHAFVGWSSASFAERSVFMVRAAELLESEVPSVAALMTAEMGKTFASAKGEVLKCAAAMRYYGAHTEAMLQSQPLPTTGSRSGVRFEPIGVIFAVMPWNFPLWQVVRMAVPTVMAGNVVVFKHAPNVPGCADYLGELFVRAGFPAGVVTNVFVDVEHVAGIIADPRIAGVTLTGSERAGRSVAEVAGRYLKKCVLELGGSDPFIVATSADLELTVPRAVDARIQNNGQACIAAKRFIVVRERAEEFQNKFVAAMASVRVGDPMDPATALGPLVSRTQRDLLSAQVSSSLAAGATALVGGVASEGPGFYFPAAVLAHVPAHSRAGREELFGPVAVVHVVDDLAAALRLANETPWGLGGSIWATDEADIERAIAGLEVGTVFANAIVASMSELPFGGTKNSGFGRELSTQGVREFTNVKSFFVA